jgi:hypothetical protein
MTQTELAALQNSITEGFGRIEQRLDGIDEGIQDVQQALHGLMFKLLRAEEINEIRSKMKNPPDLKNFPAWVIR